MMAIHVNAEQTSATVKPYEFQGNEKKALPCKRQLAYQDAQVAFLPSVKLTMFNLDPLGGIIVSIRWISPS